MKPKTFPELFKFYYELLKPLYSTIQAGNELPNEVLFEINAAFDHLSRHWAYDETEADVVSKAYSHLKRGALDIFKLAVKRANDQFAELRAINTSIIDNGDYDKMLVKLMTEIRESAAHARMHEGDTRKDDQAIYAFDLWCPVYEKCVAMEKDFYAHSRLEWAKKYDIKKTIWQGSIGVLIGIVVAIVSSFIYDAVKPAKPEIANKPAIVPQVATKPLDEKEK